MKAYEIAYIATPAFTVEEAGKFHEKIKEMISKTGGVLGREQIPAKKALAYSVKNNTEAYLASIDFEGKEEDVKKIYENIKKEEDVLRLLVIKKEIIKETEKKEKAPKKEKSLKPEKTRLKEIDEKIDEIL